MTKKLLLIILDGWGIGKNNEYNAIYNAHTPFFDACMSSGHLSYLHASGEAVGLLPGQIGSSEVGHMHIGAGRIIPQELTKITHSLIDGSFYKNKTFISACNHVTKNNTKLHLVGLLSPGGVHSHQNNLFALLKIAHDQGVKRVYIHPFLDGRDVPPASAKHFLRNVDHITRQYHHDGANTVCAVATLIGRLYAMDRDNNWEWTRKAFDLLVQGKGEKFKSTREAVRASYAKKIFDECMEPALIHSSGLIEKNDSVLFFNFRSDRMRQICSLIYEKVPRLHITTMIPYGVVGMKAHVAFQRDIVKNHLSDIFSKHKIKHIKIAETQKYPHVTYFLNGTQEKPYPSEDRQMVPSKKVRRLYDEKPEMSAFEITEVVLQKLGVVPVIMVNYANADLVGHSGVIEAGKKAVACVDMQLQKIVPIAREKGYDVVITADHGNAEEMYDPVNNSVHTAHTTNPVACILLSASKHVLKKKGSLTNVAATCLELLELPKHPLMVESLIV